MTITSSESSPSRVPGGQQVPPAPDDAVRALLERMSQDDVARLSAALRGRERRDEPWEDRTVLLLGGGTVASFALLLAAWVGASGSAAPDTLVAWLALSVASPFLFGLAATAWLVEGSGRVQARQGQLLERVVERIELRDQQEAERLRGLIGTATVAVASSGPSVALPVPDTSETPLVSSPDMSRYHHPACPLTAGKPVVPYERTRGKGSRRPCGVCLS